MPIDWSISKTMQGIQKHFFRDFEKHFNHQLNWLYAPLSTYPTNSYLPRYGSKPPIKLQTCTIRVARLYLDSIAISQFKFRQLAIQFRQMR